MINLQSFLENYTCGKNQKKWNQYSANPKYFKFSTEDVNIFNKIYFAVRDNMNHNIIRTASGAISNNLSSSINNSYAYDILKTNSYLRLTVLITNNIYVFTLGKNDDESKIKEVRPVNAWLTFVEELKKDNIDINNYAIINGAEIKKEIPMPLIKFDPNILNTVLYNVHHIDFHNSYPAGLANTHPEFRNTIERLYKLRKTNENYKAVLNYAIGCMQSLKSPWKAKWAHLAKDAINNNLERVKNIAMMLTVTGRKVLGYNTDGIWYQGDIYHDLTGESKNLGDWENDHINCTFRAKSNGAYEFIENNKYYPVMRGSTTLDTVKDRENWEWGDIYKTDIITFKFDEKDGVTYYEA